MGRHVFVGKKSKLTAAAPAEKKASGYDYAVDTVGTTPHVSVLCEKGLWATTQGKALAQACLATAEADFLRLQALFGSVTLPNATFIIAPLSGSNDGTGGAYHYSCGDPVLYCDASFGQPARTSALFLAELSEVGQATQGLGWDCGATNGEGLSRVQAETLYPGALDDYSTAAAWLDSSRPNWIDQNEGTDQDDISNGCAVLFLNWLVTVLGYGLDKATRAGATSLAGTYQQLTGKTSAWQDFMAAVNAVWPAGKPSGVTTDNPWPANSPVPPMPGPAPAPAPAPALTITLSADCPAGTYILTQPVATLGSSKTSALLGAVVAAVEEALKK